MIRRLFFLLSFAWLVPGSSPATAAPVPAESDEWSMLASLMFSEAEDAFARSAATGDRWARLGHAAALLNHPPITPRKVNRVADDLRELVAETTDDEPARFARYLLVRLAHMHQASPLNEVEAGYRALLDQSPHVVAQLAAGKLAPLLIYERVDLAPAEGLAAADGTLHPMQQAFHECHALQCGYCTPGMVMAATSLLKENPNPTEDDVRLGLEGNLCRCTGYHNIVQSVLAAAKA
jgi:hypothetical protein